MILKVCGPKVWSLPPSININTLYNLHFIHIHTQIHMRIYTYIYIYTCMYRYICVHIYILYYMYTMYIYIYYTLNMYTICVYIYWLLETTPGFHWIYSFLWGPTCFFLSPVRNPSRAAAFWSGSGRRHCPSAASGRIRAPGDSFIIAIPTLPNILRMVIHELGIHIHQPAWWREMESEMGSEL